MLSNIQLKDKGFTVQQQKLQIKYIYIHFPSSETLKIILINVLCH